MTKTETKIEVHNEHREALALACHEQSKLMLSHLGTVQELDYFRLQCNDIRYRTEALTSPRIMERYVQNRGFDPRTINSAPKLRWL